MNPYTSGSSIGAILRTIQEERAKSPAVTPPSLEPGNPIRDLTVTPPAAQSEAVGSERVIATRPEGQVAPGASVLNSSGSSPTGVPGGAMRMTSGYGSVGGANTAGSALVERKPSAAEPSTPAPSSPSTPASTPNQSTAPSQTVSRPSLATKVTTPASVLGASTAISNFGKTQDQINNSWNEINSLQNAAAQLDQQLPPSMRTNVYPNASPTPVPPKSGITYSQPKKSLAQQIMSLFGIR